MIQLEKVVLSAVMLVGVSLLPACGGPAASPPEPTAIIKSAPTPVPTFTPPTAPRATPALSTPSGPTPASPSDAELLALGKVVFEKKAGGVGCQACHGMDAKGLVGPNIRGKTADQIRTALGTVEMMVPIGKNLDAEDIEAVAAYLKWLSTQP